MLRLPHTDERAAMQFEDLASALDAGLPLAAIGGEASAGDRVLHGLLQRRGVRLTSIEDAVLAAAWRSGRAQHMLRRAATRRRQHSGVLRMLLMRLLYPAGLLGVGMMVALMTGQRGVLLIVALCLGAVIGSGLWLRHGLRAGTGPWLRLPLLGPLLTDHAELPYLEVLHGLYAAGEPILTAHPSAVGACPISAVRKRLRRADEVLQRRVPLAEALQQAGALTDESVTLIATGERAGELEDALWRALQRRSEVHARRAQQLAVAVGAAAYAFSAGIAVYLIFSYYAQVFSVYRQMKQH